MDEIRDLLRLARLVAELLWGSMRDRWRAT